MSRLRTCAALAFGLRQALDEAGSLLGPLIAMALMWLLLTMCRRCSGWPAFPRCSRLRFSALACARRRRRARRMPANSPCGWTLCAALGIRFWLFIAVLLILLLPRFTEAFYPAARARTRIVRWASRRRCWRPMALMTTFLTAPAGSLSDRIGRWPLLFAGFAALAASHVVLALAGAIWAAFLGAALVGLHLALTQGVLATLVADMVPRKSARHSLRHLPSGVRHRHAGHAGPAEKSGMPGAHRSCSGSPRR